MTGGSDLGGRGRRRWLLLAILMAVLFGFFGLERWLAARSWDGYKAQLAAAGVNLDWPSLVPPMPPDDQNFYMHPLVQKWLPARGAAKLGKRNWEVPAARGEGPPYLPPGRFGSPPTMDELAALARDELEQLRAWFAAWDEALAELRSASQRPFAMLPGNYSSPEIAPIPDFVAARSLAQALAVRARVHLLLGQSGATREDLDALGAILKGLDGKPSTLVSAMIRCALAGLYLEIVEDGFARRLWKPENLAGLQERLLSIDLLEDYVSALRDGEQAAVCYLLEKLAADADRKNRQSVAQLIAGGNNWQEKALRLVPAGWIRKNQLLAARFLQLGMALIDPEEKRYFPAKAEQTFAAIDSEFRRRRPGNFLAAVCIPNFSRASSTVAKNQSRLQLAAINCALERHRHEKGEYPERLELLAPEHLARVPHDLVTGKAPIYRRLDLDRCVLYSVGPDGNDDGGSGDDWRWMQSGR